MFWQVLKVPGVRPVYLASVIGRLPMGAIGLLFVLLTHEATGSYAAGGIVAAAEAIGAALVAPLLGRAVDRLGQRRVLIPSGIGCGLAIGAFAALPEGTPLGVVVVVAALAGMTLPPLGACQRALWSSAIEPRLRHSAFTLDSVVFELVFIMGPLVLVGGIGAWSLRAAVAVCSVAVLLGTTAFTLTTLSRGWRPSGIISSDPLGPLRGAGVRTLLIAVALFGIGISPTEIGVAAFAREHGAAGAIGVLLALWGLGSLLGGVVAGNLAAPQDPARRLSVLLFALALLQVPLALAPSPVLLGVALLLAGAMLAPSLSLTFSLLSAVAPAGTETEAQTWSTTAIGGGLALGAAFGGFLIDHAGTAAALSVPPAVGLLAALVVGGRQATLRSSPVPA